MKTIYLDSAFMCHAANDGAVQTVETDAFDSLCAGAIECYRYIPAGQAWTRPDGRITPGPFIQAVKESVDIQRQYELDEAQRWCSLGIPQEQDFTATHRYPIGSFLSVYGEIYEVISIILTGSQIILGSNVRKSTVEEYINKKVEDSKI